MGDVVFFRNLPSFLSKLALSYRRIHRFMRHNGSVDQDIKIWMTLSSLSPKSVEVGNVVFFGIDHRFSRNWHCHIVESIIL